MPREPRYVTGAELPDQWTSGSEPVTALRPIDVARLNENAGGIVDKPWAALWTSAGRLVETADGALVDTTWDEACGALLGQQPRAWSLVVPAPSTRVALIDGVEDAVALAGAYPRAIPARFDGVDSRVRNLMCGSFDWERMARDGIDGVWLTVAGLRAVRRSPILLDMSSPVRGLHAWDVESIAWLSTGRLSVEQTVVWAPSAGAASS